MITRPASGEVENGGDLDATNERGIGLSGWRLER
jgi:hypothetical protein